LSAQSAAGKGFSSQKYQLLPNCIHFYLEISAYHFESALFLQFPIEEKRGKRHDCAKKNENAPANGESVPNQREKQEQAQRDE
jgi:hypothetical protein